MGRKYAPPMFSHASAAVALFSPECPAGGGDDGGGGASVLSSKNSGNEHRTAFPTVSSATTKQKTTRQIRFCSLSRSVITRPSGSSFGRGRGLSSLT
eukprot:7353281-Prymnesium_polylepis.1